MAFSYACWRIRPCWSTRVSPKSLRAVFHLTEELDYRRQFSELPGSDIAHLAGDVSRAYSRLVIEWIDYMQYLKGHYPYLFSLAMRTNPFDLNTTPVVRD